MHHPHASRAITVATIVLAGTGTLGLAGCKTTSSSSSCKNGSCTVNISGENAETKILGDKVRLVLVHSDGKTAKVEVAGTTISCAQGDQKDVVGLSMTCDEVKDGKVKLKVSR